MPAINIERHLKTIEGLFPMPQVMARAAAKARDPESTVDDVAEVLVLDPSIVKTVVRMSNSSFYGYETRSESLKEAIQRVGFLEILRLLGSSIAQKVYQRELAHYRIPPEVFWESGIAGALLMEAFARDAGAGADDAYLAGLMREIGMIVIDHGLTCEGVGVQWDCYGPVRDWEREVCGWDHTEAGAMILERWGFSPGVCEAVRHQWDVSADASPLQLALHLTGRVLERVGCDFSVPLGAADSFAKQASLLGMDAAEFTARVANVREKFQRIRGDLAGAKA